MHEYDLSSAMVCLCTKLCGLVLLHSVSHPPHRHLRPSSSEIIKIIITSNTLYLCAQAMCRTDALPSTPMCLYVLCYAVLCMLSSAVSTGSVLCPVLSTMWFACGRSLWCVCVMIRESPTGVLTIQPLQ